jgi:CheY-like chemotaxis protein
MKSTRTPPKALDKPRVVLVDDDRDFQFIVSQWLGTRYDVASLSSGDGLLEELAATEPDLLILDVKLPGDDGFKLCRTIRADPRFESLPILFLTGSKADSDFMRYLDVGGTAYLTKPLERGQLLSMLGELLPP